MGQQHNPVPEPERPGGQKRDDEQWVLAFFPSDLLTDEADADAWDLHSAAAWSAGAAHAGGALSLRRGADAAVDDLAAWLADPDVLGRPVSLERSVYWVTVDGEYRVFPLYRVAVDTG